MTQHSDEMDMYVKERLQRFDSALPRDPEKASLGRECYLDQVKFIAQERPVMLAVSTMPLQRLNEWISSIPNPLKRKERYSMFTTLTTILVAITMLFGGASATVYAAQDSLPDDLLYPVKTFSEDAQLMLTKDPQSQLDLLMAFTNRRMNEIVAQSSAGEPVPEALAARFQHEMNHMFQIVAGMDGPPMSEALEYVGIHIRKHDRDMDMIQNKQPEQADPVMEQVREMLQLRIHLVELGLENPVAFRGQVHQLMNGSGHGPGPVNQCETIMPDEGYGPGPGSMDDPHSEECPYEGDGKGFGPGPENQGEVNQPEDGYGPEQGTPNCDDCQQEGGGSDRTGPGSTGQGGMTPPEGDHQHDFGSMGTPPGDDCTLNCTQTKPSHGHGSSK